MKRSNNPLKEGFLTALTGILYGATNTLVGHPFDTIKTKMQAQNEHFKSHSGVLQTTRNVWQKEGLVGFYRGCIPPFFGSIIFRSLQFSIFELFYTKWEQNERLKQTIPYTFGLQYRVPLAAFVAANARAVIECPFEYAKVRGQTGQSWKFNEAYRGFSILYPRTVGLMTFYLCMIDSLRRNTNLFKTAVGQFFVSGTIATMAFWIIWPFETLKNQAQADVHKTSLR